MGGRVATHPLDISDYALQVNRGDTTFNNLWGQGRYSIGDWIPNIEDEFFHSEQQWRALREEPRLNWGAKRKYNGPIDILLTQAQAKLWHQREVKTISVWWLGIEKGSRHCKEPILGKAGV